MGGRPVSLIGGQVELPQEQTAQMRACGQAEVLSGYAEWSSWSLGEAISGELRRLSLELPCTISGRQGFFLPLSLAIDGLGCTMIFLVYEISCVTSCLWHDLVVQIRVEAFWCVDVL